MIFPIFLLLVGIMAIVFFLILMADKYEKPEKKERKAVEEDNRNQVYTGKRGGRYTEDKTKDGRPYRRYF